MRLPITLHFYYFESSSNQVNNLLLRNIFHFIAERIKTPQSPFIELLYYCPAINSQTYNQYLPAAGG